MTIDETARELRRIAVLNRGTDVIELLDELDRLREAEKQWNWHRTALQERCSQLHSQVREGVGILSGHSILAAVERGDIVIDPFDPDAVQPSSIDLTLADEIKYYPDLPDFMLDPSVDQYLSSAQITADGFLLRPATLYLMHTVERVHTPKYSAVIDGKSSLGRLGVSVHQTAGYVDPGFDGQYTLEVTVVHPTRIYSGMAICQVRFYTVAGPVMDYRSRGHYVGENAKGAVGSMAHEQIQEAFEKKMRARSAKNDDP